MTPDSTFNVVGVVPVTPPSSPQPAEFDSFTAMGLAELPAYLRRAPDRTEQEELIARDAFLCGYRAGYVRGGTDALRECTTLATLLNDRRFRNALARLTRFFDRHDAA